MLMQYIKKNGHIIIGQILFFTLFVWYFIHNSFLRPNNDKVIECGLAMILVAAMSINYWLLYPFFYKKRSFWYYAVVTILEATLAASLEYKWTICITLQYLPAELIQASSADIKRLFFFNLFMRDFCLMAFAGLMADNLGQKFRMMETDNIMLKRKKQILAQQNNKDHIINAENICYAQQRQNYTYIFTNDGQRYDRRGSLNFFEEAPECLHAVRISRNTIVFMPYVLTLNNKEVTVITKENPCKVENLPLGKTIAPAAILEIERFLQHKEKRPETKKHVLSNGREKSYSSGTVESAEMSASENAEGQIKKNPAKKRKESKKGIQIQEFIFHHQDCNIGDIVAVTKIPKSTVTRYLKELQAQNLIEYVGSKKTGGYRVVEK